MIAHARTLSRKVKEACAAIIAALGVMLLISTLIQSAAAHHLARVSVSSDMPHDQPSQGFNQTTEGPAVNYPNCRFGLGGNVSAYAVTALNMGWYMDWGTQLNPPRPGGAEYVQVVHLQPGPEPGYIVTPSLTTVLSNVMQNPGAVWLIGNEPDSPFQDRLTPEVYARAYHDLYTAVKQRDPTARIGAGSIVQPTPLRLQYLDRVLNAYGQLYGAALPADVWSIHSYILRELDPSDPDVLSGTLELWGAFIPPGMFVTRGELYTYSQMFNVALFRQRLITFRSWLRDRGYRDTPVYITEFGTLFPYPPYNVDENGVPWYWVDEFGVEMTEARTATYMLGTFDVLRTATDASIGYPADANHLVQRWLWYSVNDPTYGGILFDPITGTRRPLGDVFAAHTQAIPPSIDLLAVKLTADPVVGQIQTATLRVMLSNIGSISITSPISVAFYSGRPLSGTMIGSRVMTSSLDGCGAAVEVSLAWPDLSPGHYPVYARIDPANAIGEVNEANNLVTGEVFVATRAAYLPRVIRNPFQSQ